jgi:hypothetical protein
VFSFARAVAVREPCESDREGGAADQGDCGCDQSDARRGVAENRVNRPQIDGQHDHAADHARNAEQAWNCGSQRDAQAFRMGHVHARIVTHAAQGRG